jgi:cobalamin biosynthesis protein CobD/CbiB
VRVIASVTDVILLLAFTLGGSLIFYMSFVSNHTACFNNFNIMWMHPLYIIGLIAYFIKNEWISHIGKVFLGAVVGLVIASYWLPQHFSIEVFTLIAIALILNYRLIQRGQNNIQHKN